MSGAGILTASGFRIGATADEVVDIARSALGDAWAVDGCAAFVWGVTNLVGLPFFDVRDMTFGGDPFTPKDDFYVVPHSPGLFSGTDNVGGDGWLAVSSAPNVTSLLSVLQPGDVVRVYAAGNTGEDTEFAGGYGAHSFIVTSVTATDVTVVDNWSNGQITEHSWQNIVDAFAPAGSFGSVFVSRIDDDYVAANMPATLRGFGDGDWSGIAPSSSTEPSPIIGAGTIRFEALGIQTLPGFTFSDTFLEHDGTWNESFDLGGDWAGFDFDLFGAYNGAFFYEVAFGGGATDIAYEIQVAPSISSLVTAGGSITIDTSDWRIADSVMSVTGPASGDIDLGYEFSYTLGATNMSGTLGSLDFTIDDLGLDSGGTQRRDLINDGFGGSIGGYLSYGVSTWESFQGLGRASTSQDLDMSAVADADPFLTLTGDIDKALGTLFPSLKPLSGLKLSALGGAAELSIGLIDLAAEFGLGLRQRVRFDAGDIGVTIVSSTGQTVNGILGDQFAFAAPASGIGDITFDISYSLSGTLEVAYDLVVDGALSYALGAASASIGGIIDVGVPPFLSGDLISGDLFAFQIATMSIPVTNFAVAEGQLSSRYDQNFVVGDPTTATPQPTSPATSELIVGDATMGVLNGTTGNDSIVGTVRSVEVNGLSGDDIIITGSGFDTIYGGGGNDVIDVGSGLNAGYTGAGDSAFGGAGDDWIKITSPGSATYPNWQYAFVDGGEGFDRLSLSLSNDLDPGRVRLGGYAGGSVGREVKASSSFEDIRAFAEYAGPEKYLITWSPDAVNDGWYGAVRVTGIEEFHLTGSDQNNDLLVLAGNGGAALGRGGEQDALYADWRAQTTGITWNLRVNNEDTKRLANGVTVQGIERVLLQLGSGDDVITSGNLNDVIYGGGGNDVIDVGSGLNAGYTGAGDSAFGGAGDD
ncbi:calcium-binding protein, partial [Neoroseomonas soli]|nr:hypothetical protein [Neoroseomonas soli]